VAQALGPDASVAELSTAVLHDVLEDTDWTKDDLAESGVEGPVLEAIHTLTRRPHEEDEEFIARICAASGDVGEIARRVKLADLTVNLANADSREDRERYERDLSFMQRAVQMNRDGI
jgi:(p)ppGpp synthase/HD superfamily hydrolase